MSNQDIRSAVAAEVRAAAGRAGLRQIDVSRSARISRPSMSRKWRGETSYTVDELVAIAGVFDIDPGTLMPRIEARAAA